MDTIQARVEQALRLPTAQQHLRELYAEYEQRGAAKSTGIPSYRAMHKRIAKARGKASSYVCPCGVQAEQWSYRAGSGHEVTGTVQSRMRTGEYRPVTVTYSIDIHDYDPLCRPCHLERDWTPERREHFSAMATEQHSDVRLQPGLVLFMVEMLGMTHRETAEAVGRSRERVTQIISEIKAGQTNA